MSCQFFRQGFPTAYLELCKSLTETPTLDGNQTEVTSHFLLVILQLREMFDISFADAILQDGLPCNTCQSPSWNSFCTLVFGSACKISHREKHLWHVSAHFIWWAHWKVHEQAKGSPRNFLSIDCFSDIRPRSAFHGIHCFPIPLHAQSFRLGFERMSVVNMNKNHWHRTQPMFPSLSHWSRKRLRFCNGLAKRFHSN